MPKKGQRVTKPKKKTQSEWCDDLVAYLSEHVGEELNLFDLAASFPDPRRLIRRLRAKGYPVKIIVSADDKAKVILPVKQDEACKFCRGRGCLMCNGTGAKPVDSQEEQHISPASNIASAREGGTAVQRSPADVAPPDNEQVKWTPINDEEEPLEFVC